MRAVRSTINAAGMLRKQDPQTDEFSLVLKAVTDINLPKFLKNDIPLFKNILLDLFPGTQNMPRSQGALGVAIEESIRELQLHLDLPFVEKVWQLRDTMQIRHGLMLVGPTGGGKTSN